MHEPAFATLVEMLRHRARRSPETTAFTFAGRSHPFALLWERAGRFASLLMAGGVGPGDHVLMALPNGPEFFYAFYGALRAGAAAVPIFPRSGVRRITDMASLSRSAAIVAPSDYPETQWARLKAACQGRDILLVRRFDGPPVDGSTRFPTAAPEDIAYIQYTSGSTGDPKGVRLSHANLMTNVTQLIDGMRITPADCFVSWLPVHHDMGLILKTLTPFYLKAPLHLLPTRLTHVHTWLDAIQTHRATFTAAPDFAWRLLNRYVRDPGAYDL
ncbi:MAG: fatty acyl-AMP ligase, partial [Desulfobacterales bacterium]|nr:fatty acyl-AMP ligase [Desulfobacterales bacterium]